MVMKPWYNPSIHGGTFHTELQLIIPHPQRHQAGGITQNDVARHVLNFGQGGLQQWWVSSDNDGIIWFFHETQLELYKV